MPEHHHCPALFVAAPASGQGKTTITAALARRHRQQGRRVRVFKCGADLLDPNILAIAAGAPCYQLDLFMGGEAHCRQLLYEAAADADLILIEGVMGLFDGSPSSADLAQLLGVPVLAVIDANAMAQTFAAVAHGLAHYRPQLPFAGVAANGVAGSYHRTLLESGLGPATPLLGHLAHDPRLALPDQHVGPTNPELEQRLDALASALVGSPLDALPAAVAFPKITEATPRPLLQGQRIAVAQDAAFCGAYPANLDLLTALGAELHIFSPLTATELPAADSLYLPAGQIERHLLQLATNQRLLAAIRAHHAAKKPILAEGAGFLYLLESVTVAGAQPHALAALLPGQADIGTALKAIGPRTAELPEGSLRGNCFHYTTVDTTAPTITTARNPDDSPGAEPIYRQDRLTASNMQFYFPSNPKAIARLLS